jgi:hypothetical protein
LISADFLASDFIVQNELPPLLAAAEQDGAVILPVIISPSGFTKTSSLVQFQAVNPPDMPLIKLPKAKQEEYLVQITTAIEHALKTSVSDSEKETADTHADPGWPETPPKLDWPMADHSGAREAFATLLTRNAPWRFLPVHGPSETGKSHITHQMLADALRIPDLACGRFDFKGSTDMDAEVHAFVQVLDVLLPLESTRLNERLRHILRTLIEHKQPTLLIFDTYEAAGKPQEDWVERELLTTLVRAPWLRIVIAGQHVPKSFGVVWASVARAAVEVKPPPPADWFDYGKQHRPELKLEEVETAWRLANEKVSLLAQLLDPVN